MRIGLFTDTYAPQINGVSTVVQLMAREFDSWGHASFVFAPSYPERQIEPRERVWRFPSKKVRFHPESRLTWPYRRRVPEALSSLDVVHSHTPFSLGLLALWAAHHYGLPHVHTYHTYFTEYLHYLPRAIRPSKAVAQRASRAFCDRCDLVLAPSAEMKAELERYGLHTPVRAMPFGVDLEAFRGPVEFDLRAELGLASDARLLLTAGRLGPEKNFGFLLDAFAEVHRRVPAAVLALAGDGPARPQLEAQAAELGLGEATRFLGYVERTRLIDCYRAAELFVFASKTETQGIVLLEAQAAGTPPVAVGAMGTLDVVTDGRSGRLDAEEREAFAEAVVSLLSDEPARRALADGARALAAEHSARRSCEALLDLYGELAEDTAARRKLNAKGHRT